jgi:signal transduction histidine kinase/CheY-like chemotaxis protein
VSDPGGWLDTIDPLDAEAVGKAYQRLQRGEPVDAEYRITRPDGTSRWIRDHASPVRDAANAILRYVGVARDITQERRIEDELRQASKMEAIDTLAAGIAHDFRNLLHGIAGCAAVAERELERHGRVDAYLRQIRDATRRGTALTDQLMAFSRRQDADRPQPVVVDAFIEGSAPLLMRLVGEQVRVELRLNAPRATIMADPVQLERILMNLASNACDAMPEGGALVIRTDAVTLDEGDPLRQVVGIAGPCVRLEVRDTGTGMDDATRERIFEPFFTTKEVGRGTGLGLSAVFGITRKLGGRVAVDSTLGVGTAFTFWLPRCADASTRMPTGPHPVASLSGLALLVEDDPLVRASIRAELEQLGMRVVTAEDPRRALAVVETLPTPPTLLITDVMMPHMTGPRLAEQLRARFPALRVLLVSAHAAEDLVERGTLAPGTMLLRKPFDQAALARHVIDVLAAEAPAVAPGPAVAPSPAVTEAMILLVDDDEDGRELLAMLLEREGLRVLVAGDAEAALQLAAEHSGPIGLLITDMSLPEMKGDELARRIRAQRPEVEVLFVSGSPATPEMELEGESLLKPIALEELVSRARRLLAMPPRARR